MIKDLLEGLDGKGFDYVIWKNVHELSEGLAGERDVDVFLLKKSRTAVVNFLRENGWVRFIEHSIRYPLVEHFYNVDEEGRIYHINIYFKIITGESWLKEFAFPIDDYLMRHRIKKDGLWMLDDNSQAYIFYLRHCIKNASLLSRFIYRKELDSYQNEWLLYKKTNQNIEGPNGTISSTALNKAGLFDTKIIQPSMLFSIQSRWNLAANYRFSMLFTVFFRYWFLLRKIYFRKILKRKKEAPLGGIVVAICGGDGSGKTTLLGKVHDNYSEFMTVKQVHLGKPQGRFVEFIRTAMFKTKTSAQISRERKLKSDAGVNNSDIKVTLKMSITMFVLAYLRLRMAKKAHGWAQKGFFVISDRWPTDQAGHMDGPKIKPTKSVSTFQQYLWSRTESMYRAMPRADAVILLQVNVDEALERNRSRNESEDEAHILWAHNDNTGHCPLADEVIRFNNDDTLENATKRINKLVWNIISSRIC